MEVRGGWLAVFVGSVFFVAGCGALIAGVFGWLEEERYETEGRSAEARILGKRVEEARSGSRVRKAYMAAYRFAGPAGRTFEGKTEIERKTWEAAQPGDSLAIVYLASAPQTSRAAGASGRAEALVSMAIGPPVALFGIFLAFFAWRSMRRRP